jgi:hypothetical protein
MIGDSPARDLAGAHNAGIDCILVGGEAHPDALGCYPDLLQLCDEVCRNGQIEQQRKRM